MNDQLKNQLDARIQSFAAEITAILQSAVADAIASALADPRAKAVSRASAPAAPRAKARAAMDASALLREVTRKPGQRMEELAKSLGTPTKVLRTPMAALLAAKKVKKSGQARGTKYRAG